MNKVYIPNRKDSMVGREILDKEFSPEFFEEMENYWQKELQIDIEQSLNNITKLNWKPTVRYKTYDYYIGSRQCGKTTWILSKLLTNKNVAIVVRNEKTLNYMKKRIKRIAYNSEYLQTVLNHSLSSPVDRIFTYHSLINKSEDFSRFEIYVDDMERLIYETFGEIKGFSMTDYER